MPQPLISVIIPCYNQGHYLGQAIDSILAQTYGVWECIIINDGATDNTSSVARSYTARDPRILYFEQRNLGLPASRNRALQYAKGEYIQFLDADDVIAPNKFAAQLQALSGIPGPAIAYCDHCRWKDDDTANILACPLGSPRFLMSRPLLDIASRWETAFSIPIHSFLFDGRFFNELAIKFDETLPTHADWDCWLQIFATNPVVVHVNEILATYRINSRGLTSNHRKMWKGVRQVCTKNERIFRSDPEMRRTLVDKRRRMRIIYRASWWRGVAKSIRNTWRNTVPWPIQRALSSMVGFRLRGNQRALPAIGADGSRTPKCLSNLARDS